MPNVFIFDTETTGLIKNELTPLSQQPEIIEFYGCLIDENDQLIDELDLLLKPSGQVSEEITKITGITNAMLENAPKFAQHADAIQKMVLESHVVSCHNLNFDKAMIDNEFRRIGRTFLWPKRKICTVESTEFITGKRLNLNALHTELFGVGFESAHRAKNDVIALVKCFCELRKRGVV